MKTQTKTTRKATAAKTESAKQRPSGKKKHNIRTSNDDHRAALLAYRNALESGRDPIQEAKILKLEYEALKTEKFHQEEQSYLAQCKAPRTTPISERIYEQAVRSGRLKDGLSNLLKNLHLKATGDPLPRTSTSVNESRGMHEIARAGIMNLVDAEEILEQAARFIDENF